MAKSIAIIGHRSNPACAGENTLNSFKSALDEKVWGVEIEIRQCKTGEEENKLIEKNP